jgi:hypothetical protein
MLNWPSELTPTFKNFVTCEYASLNKQGAPITYPCTPYVGEHTLDVSTGLTYPAKAERARRNPKVGLLFSYARGSGLTQPPTVLVLGHAAVRDSNLQANTDRYVRASLAKNPATFKGQPKLLLRNLTWYFARIWIEVTPLQILWWPEGNLGAQPQTWEAPRDVALPKSDPEPPGAQPAPWQEAPLDWHLGLKRALKLGKPVLTVVNADGYPVPVRVADARMEKDDLWLSLHPGTPLQPQGQACLTFHTHPEVFTGQENLAFVGSVSSSGNTAIFKVARQLGDWSLAGRGLKQMSAFLGKQRVLAPRLKSESARRGQPVPKVNLT